MTCDWGHCDFPAAGWRWWIRWPYNAQRPLLVPVCWFHEPMDLELVA